MTFYSFHIANCFSSKAYLDAATLSLNHSLDRIDLLHRKRHLKTGNKTINIGFKIKKLLVY